MSDAFSSYDELQNVIAKWLNRLGDPELAERVPDFIFLAELRIEREIDWPQNELGVVGALEAGNSELALAQVAPDFSWGIQLTLLRDLPSNLELVSMFTLEQIRANQPLGPPCAMALAGMTYQLAPTPDANYSYRLRYMAGMPKLASLQQTTWLLAQGPDCLLYGALLASAPFLSDDSRVPLWEGFFRDAVRSLKRVAVRQRTGGGTLRVRPDRWA